MNRHVTLLALVIAALALAGSAQAVNYQWDGGGGVDTDVLNPANWNPDGIAGSVAGQKDYTVVDGGGSATISNGFGMPLFSGNNAWRLGLGVAYQGVDSIPATSGGNGTVIQTGGNANFYQSVLGIGRDTGVGVYQLDGGTLVLANELGPGTADLNWDYDRFTSAYNMANFRAFGEEITSASQLLFTPTTVTLASDPGPWKTYNATAVTAVILSVPGDTNADRVVDAADFITLKKNFGAGVGAGAAAGNFDNTGTVDWADLGTLMSNMGVPGPATTAPEPATLGLLVIGALAVLRRRAIIGRTGR